MRTIQTYEEDGSAMSRIHAWHAAWNIATDRFLGGGFEYPSPTVTAKYSPGPYDSVAHSIYFQALGEHGFIGLGLFLLFWIMVWRQCSATRRKARDRPDLKWAFSLMSMTQVSLVGFAVGGAFLNLAFWDMPYYLYAMIVVTEYVVRKTLASTEPALNADPHRNKRPSRLPQQYLADRCRQHDRYNLPPEPRHHNQVIRNGRLSLSRPLYDYARDRAASLQACRD